MRDNFLHFAHPGVYLNLLMMSCVIFIFRGAGHSYSGANDSSRLKTGRGTSGRTSLKTPEGALQMSALLAQISLLVIGSQAHLPCEQQCVLLCGNVFPAKVPSFRHHTTWNLPGNSEHHSSTKWQEFPSMCSFLQPLISRFAGTRHMTFVKKICGMLDDPRKHR